MEDTIPQQLIFPETIADKLSATYQPGNSGKNALLINGSVLSPLEPSHGLRASLFFKDLVQRASENDDLKLAYTTLDIRQNEGTLCAELNYNGESRYEGKAIIFNAKTTTLGNTGIQAYTSAWSRRAGSQIIPITSAQELQKYEHDRQALKSHSKKIVAEALAYVGLGK